MCDLRVNRLSGEIKLEKIFVSHDCGQMVNPAGVRHQVHGNIVQCASRVLKEFATFDGSGTTSLEWGSYPLLRFDELPQVEINLLDYPDEPAMGAGESASVPARLRLPMRCLTQPACASVRHRLLRIGYYVNYREVKHEKWQKKPIALGVLLLLAGSAAALLSMQPEIAPISPLQTPSFSAQSIARGKTLAALGDCAVCHTRNGGATNSGGLAMESPFGTIYTSNITPDMDSGIGAWSYPAFERAMRHGIDRQGNYLYPAFPYTAFTHTNDQDLRDLYAYLMSQPRVSYQPPQTSLRFPFNIRQGMAAWNWLYLQPGALPPNPQQDAQWNRGAYLAESLGHCSACHSPRNFAAAEKPGAIVWQAALPRAGPRRHSTVALRRRLHGINRS
ncbi:molybdopterin cofactor-binding domain-containing protein [Erwinia aphidicola]